MDLSLNDIVRIVVVCLVGGASIVAAGFAWDQRAIIGAVLGALRRRYLTVSFDGLMESIADDTPYRDTGDIDQLKPASMGAPQTGAIPSDEALARHLAALTKPNGTHWLSANKIVAAVGGDRATVLAWIREERGQPDPAQPAKRQIALRHNGVEELVEVDW